MRPTMDPFPQNMCVMAERQPGQQQHKLVPQRHAET